MPNGKHIKTNLIIIDLGNVNVYSLLITSLSFYTKN